ncbi:unnamed protein product [Linum tenue]|uniref:Uncharacterized protein n=1 Tax=Linum tenue TaxID=586396 RepID=A0AAV0R258_9ROSI|nr:unnamed protein product [Linum tenue]
MENFSTGLRWGRICSGRFVVAAERVSG